MRVSMSPNGSFTAMILSSPARLHEAWNEALVAEIAQRDTAHPHLAIIAARATRHFATVANAHRGAIARQRGKPDARFETLFHRQLFIVGEVQQAFATGQELLDHPLLALV